jgi:hypothetical protein
VGKGKGPPRADETLALPGFSKLVRRRKAAPVVTWITPYHDAYVAAYGEKPNRVVFARMLRALAPLDKEHGSEEVARRLARYLAETPARFFKIERFGQTFAAWKGAAGRPAAPTDPLDPQPGEDVDAYIARLARPSR